MKLLARFLFNIATATLLMLVPAKAATIQDRHLSGFTSINLSASYDVYITQGANESVKVEGPQDELSRIVTQVSNGVLNIYQKNTNGFSWNWGGKKKAVYVVARDINGITISGSGDVYFRSGLNTNTIKISVSGSGDVTGLLHAHVLNLIISGSGDVRLSGRADAGNIRVSGSGDFLARDLVTVNTAIKVTGSGDATINVTNRLDAAISGSGDIRYTGGAKQVSAAKSGSGDIHRM